MSKIPLQAVPGRCCPVPGKRSRFYGLRAARAGETVVHSVPGGVEYASAGEFEVEGRADGTPRDAYLRRAVLRGDLALAPATAPKKSTGTKPDEER